MQTCLVAGGAGFIGSHLCKSLLSDGYRIICVDNLITGDKSNIAELLTSQNFLFIENDVTKPLEIEEGVDFIFHLASPASPNKNSPKSYINLPLETLLANSQGTHCLLDLAKQKQSKFLFTSTSEVYGDPKVSPQAEDYFGNVNPNGVRSVYDEAKRFGEAITMSYVRSGLDARIIRIFNTYGPLMQKDDGRVVSEFAIQAIRNEPFTIYGDGQQTRSFCFVDDMVEGIKKAMFTEETKGEVINLGNPIEKSMLELAEIIKRLAGSTSEISYEPLPEDDPKTRRPDISKAKSLLDWEPRVGIEEGLGKTIQYFKEVV
jgi:nucleoside-diphosphate-sugar epimerase